MLDMDMILQSLIAAGESSLKTKGKTFKGVVGRKILIPKKEYPVIMMNILQQHYSDKYLINYAEFSEKAEVVTNYYPAYDECVIHINEVYRQDRLQKRLNFSLAHEFGHLILQHHRYTTPVGLPPYYEKEADEFAGQFLMPDFEIALMPSKWKLLSEFFFVSTVAARVRLDKIKSRHFKRK